MVRTLYFFNFDLFLKMLDGSHLPYFGLVTIGVCPDTRHGISGFRRAWTILSESSVPVIFIIQLLYGFRVWIYGLDGLIQTRGNVARKKSARNTSRRRVWISGLDGLIQTRVSTNQSTRYIHVIL
jgi:hypothetical protein